MAKQTSAGQFSFLRSITLTLRSDSRILAVEILLQLLDQRQELQFALLQPCSPLAPSSPCSPRDIRLTRRRLLGGCSRILLVPVIVQQKALDV
jgi:hypothetical protein